MKAMTSPFGYVPVLCAALAVAVPAGAQQEGPQYGLCPPDRTHIEPLLNTVPDDGEAYTTQRMAIRMPIEQVVEAMGGVERALLIALVTKDSAQKTIDAGVGEAERRNALDTILRADALIEILDCLVNGPPV